MATAVVTTPTFGRSSDEPWEILKRAGVRAVRPAGDRPPHRSELIASVGSSAALIVGLDPIDRDVLAAAPDADGCVPVPDGPGLGVSYGWDAIAAHTVETVEFH